jgi:hypothetical protein
VRKTQAAALTAAISGSSWRSSVRGEPHTVQRKLYISDMKPAAGMVRISFIDPAQIAHGAVVGLEASDFRFMDTSRDSD